MTENRILDLEFMREIYKLQYIKRYNTWQRINNESVAEHSFFVVLFTHKICKMLNLPDKFLLKAMEISMIHDLPEIVINDITHDAKCVMPEIVPILDKYETKYLSEHYSDIMNKDDFTSDDMELLNNIFKMADCLSAIQYSDNEVQLGNKRFELILKEASDRYLIHEEIVKNLMKLRRAINNEN
jgi:5'-deoxynucleotidase YfbR-like HD superfamily hydrolase